MSLTLRSEVALPAAAGFEAFQPIDGPEIPGLPLAVEELAIGGESLPFGFAPLPLHHGFGHAERIAIGRQSNKAVEIGLLLGIDAQDDLGAGGAPAALAYQAFPSQISHIQQFGGQLLQVGRRQRLAFGCTALTDLKLLAQPGQARGVRRLDHKVTHNFEGSLACLPVGSGFELDGVAGGAEIPGSEPLQKLSAAA